MAITISATYSKKLGLPNYSSHSFLVTVQAEISNLRRLESETERLYRLLQSSVDRQVQEVGFLPDATKYGMNGSNGKPATEPSSNGALDKTSKPSAADWNCSEKQRNFIAQIAKRMKLTLGDLDNVAHHLFMLPAPKLDRKQASRLIDELFAVEGKGTRSNRVALSAPMPVIFAEQ